MNSKIAIISGLLCLSVQMGLSQEFKTVRYFDGRQELESLLVDSLQPGRPGVLILPAWKGIDSEAKSAALKLYHEGYNVLIADIYGLKGKTLSTQQAKIYSDAFKKNYEQYQRRIFLAMEAFKQQGLPFDKMAIIGYCFGGTGVLEAMRAGFEVKALVCIHGGLAKNADRNNRNKIGPSLLVQHPAEDASVSIDDYQALVKELNQGEADWQIITYAKSKHTFTNPESPDYNRTMANRAWQHLLLFLSEQLLD